MKLKTLFLIVLIIVLIAIIGGETYYIIQNNNAVTQLNVEANNLKRDLAETKNTVNTKEEEKQNIIAEKDAEKNENSKNTTKIEKVGKIKDDKDIVYSFFKKGKIDIPYININSDYVKKINEQIEEDYKEEIESYDSIPESVEYTKYINGNILSLLITTKGENDYRGYKTYNINMLTGEAITNLEIIHSKSIKGNEYVKKLKDKYDKEYYNELKNKDTLDNVLREYSCSIDTPIYLDQNGNINAIVKVCTRAGAEYYNFILNTNI